MRLLRFLDTSRNTGPTDGDERAPLPTMFLLKKKIFLKKDLESSSTAIREDYLS